MNNTIGFIGLGHMGSPMVRNLLSHNVKVKIFDVNTAAMEALQPLGAIKTTHIAEMVKDCDIVFTMVQTGQQVKECCLGAKGIFANIKAGALYIDSSTIDVKTSKELHAIAQQKKVAMLDAPVSGGVAGATAATLTFMVGGAESDFKRAKPILDWLGKTIIHAGPAGSGGAAKICNNMVLGVSMIAVCEAFALAEKIGLAPEKLFEICSASSGQCWSLTKYCPWPNILENVPSSHDYKPGFTTSMMLKDLILSQETADYADIDAPLGKHATQLFQQFVDKGCGDVDFSGIINMFRKKTDF